MIDQGRPLGYTIAGGAFFAAASAVDTFPVGTRLRPAMLLAVGDYPSETAPIAWNARQLLDRPLHRFDPEFLYSHSNTHAYWQSVLIPGAMAAPLLPAHRCASADRQRGSRPGPDPERGARHGAGVRLDRQRRPQSPRRPGLRPCPEPHGPFGDAHRPDGLPPAGRPLIVRPCPGRRVRARPRSWPRWASGARRSARSSRPSRWGSCSSASSRRGPSSDRRWRGHASAVAWWACSCWPLCSGPSHRPALSWLRAVRAPRRAPPRARRVRASRARPGAPGGRPPVTTAPLAARGAAHENLESRPPVSLRGRPRPGTPVGPLRFRCGRPGSRTAHGGSGRAARRASGARGRRDRGGGSGALRPGRGAQAR